jgi:hypothetical protein
MTDTRDFKALNITVKRTTRKSSISGVWVDNFSFTIGQKVWSVNVVRKDTVLNRTAGETLTIALNALSEAHDVTFVNTPNRVDNSDVLWVSGKDLLGNGPIA